MVNISPQDLLNLYARGVFPMAESRDDSGIFVVDPEKRAVFPMNALKISKTLAKRIRNRAFEIRINTVFNEVVDACAAPRDGHEETWINDQLRELYDGLHRLDHAHSVECWHTDELVGGLYGVSLAGAFFGESMFSRRNDASKVALVHLVERLKAGGFSLLDAQFQTDHLKSLGAIEINRDAYHKRLLSALQTEGNFYPSGFSEADYCKFV